MCREGAEDAVKEYYSKIGGRPEPPSKPGRGKRKSMTASAKDTPERTTSKKQKTSKQETNGTEVFVGTDIPRGIPDWVRDKDHWEEDVAKVQTITHDEDRNLVAYLIWTNGKTTKVSIGLCYEKIPMLVSWLVAYFMSKH